MTPGITTPPADGTVAETQSNSNGDSPTDDRSVLSVIGDIQRGAIDAKSLGIEDRRRCVVHLTSEGYSAAETAQILKVTERTIARDRAVIRRANSIERDPKMIGEMVGQLVTQADTCLQRIRRVTRERDTPSNVRVEGEKACWIIARDLLKCLQSLGYLPTAPQEIRGELTHQIEHVPAFGEIQEEVARLEVIVNTHANFDDGQPLLQALAHLKDHVMRSALHEEVTALALRLSEAEEASDVNGQ